MAFIIENGTGSPLEIDDLGIRLDVGEITELGTRTQPQEVALSMEVGNELYTLINAGDIVVKDPLDGVTDLSIADAITCLQSINDPHWRVGAGALIGDISDVVLTAPAVDQVLQFNGSTWQNAPLTSGFFQLEWRFQTSTVAADPTSGRFRYDNSTLASVTNIYFDDFSLSGFDVGAVFNQLSVGSIIYIQQNSTQGNAVLFEVSGSPVDNGGWWTVPVTVTDSGTLHSNNSVCSVIFVAGGGGSGGSTIITQDEGVVVTGGPHSTLNFVGGGVVATDAGSGVTTVSIPGGAGVSNAITTVVGDTGSFTGVGEDTINILGGSGISTAISGDTLTITNDSPNVDQNIWLTMVSDAGSVAANTTTDQFSILGGLGIDTSISGDILTIVLNAALDDLSDVDASSPDPESHLVFDDGSGNWEPQAPDQATPFGQMFEIVFSNESSVDDSWIASNGTPSNEAPPVCGWEARL